MGKQYKTIIEDLPGYIKNSICEFRPDDAETWVFKEVPALENESVLAVMNKGEDEQKRVYEYWNKVIGYFR